MMAFQARSDMQGPTPPIPILPAVTLLRPQARSISTPLSLPGWTGAARNTGRARARGLSQRRVPGAMLGVTRTASVGVAEGQTAPPADGLTFLLPLHLKMNHKAVEASRQTQLPTTWVTKKRGQTLGCRGSRRCGCLASPECGEDVVRASTFTEPSLSARPHSSSSDWPGISASTWWSQEPDMGRTGAALAVPFMSQFRYRLILHHSKKIGMEISPKFC